MSVNTIVTVPSTPREAERSGWSRWIVSSSCFDRHVKVATQGLRDGSAETTNGPGRPSTPRAPGAARTSHGTRTRRVCEVDDLLHGGPAERSPPPRRRPRSRRSGTARSPGSGATTRHGAFPRRATTRPGRCPAMSVPDSFDRRPRTVSPSPSAMAFVHRSMTRRISSDGSTAQAWRTALASAIRRPPRATRERPTPQGQRRWRTATRSGGPIQSALWTGSRP